MIWRPRSEWDGDQNLSFSDFLLWFPPLVIWISPVVNVTLFSVFRFSFSYLSFCSSSLSSPPPVSLWLSGSYLCFCWQTEMSDGKKSLWHFKSLRTFQLPRHSAPFLFSGANQVCLWSDGRWSASCKTRTSEGTQTQCSLVQLSKASPFL